MSPRFLSRATLAACSYVAVNAASAVDPESDEHVYSIVNSGVD